VRASVTEVLARQQYQDLVLVSVDVQSGGLPFAPQPERVVVTVGKPPGSQYPRLARDLAARINDGSRNLDVEVRFVETEVVTRAGGSGTG